MVIPILLLKWTTPLSSSSVARVCESLMLASSRPQQQFPGDAAIVENLFVQFDAELVAGGVLPGRHRWWSCARRRAGFANAKP